MHIPFLSVALALTLAAFATAHSSHADLSLEARDYIDELTTREVLAEVSTRELLDELSARGPRAKCKWCKSEVQLYPCPIKRKSGFRLTCKMSMGMWS
ncbi:hypothetical protein D9611_007332 [Ephemerocybe angulata]|uniref:Uncharacterized protein n=1 Tax=Ephemerocybe angulata TaxID=980116 RepID=A0A8H5CGL0_9AGAR|nr:hypothetical protein D9611_007332 [Tulosesus angulatus]